MFLTEEEIQELTGRKRHDLQRQALNQMGIEYRVRHDKSLSVLRAHVEAEMGMSVASTNAAEFTPNFDNI